MSIVRSIGLTSQVSPLSHVNQVPLNSETLVSDCDGHKHSNGSISGSGRDETSTEQDDSSKVTALSPVDKLTERILLVSFTSGLLSVIVAVISINRTIFMTFYPAGSLLMSTVFALRLKRNICNRVTFISLITFVLVSLVMMTLGFTLPFIRWHSCKVTALTIGLFLQIVLTLTHAIVSVH